MCGRFTVSGILWKDVESIVSGVEAGLDLSRAGDIYPSDDAVIISGRGDGLYAGSMKWGFPAFADKKLLINARAETALEKKTFADSVRRRRCIIPAAGFYEWDRQKNKVTFTLPGENGLYMAGFYRKFEDRDRFIILTMAANGSMLPVHDRMPLILPKEDLPDWIHEPGKTKEFLARTGLELARHQEYEQMTLF